MPEPGSPQPRRPFQFSVRSLLLITLLCSILSAALAGMLRGGEVVASMPPGFFVLMAAAAPVAMAILISLTLAAARALRRRSGKDR